jgi:IS5 family transposase
LLLDRNFLRGRDGDAINALLAAAGHNLRLLRRWLAQPFAVLLAAMRSTWGNSVPPGISMSVACIS